METRAAKLGILVVAVDSVDKSTEHEDHDGDAQHQVQVAGEQPKDSVCSTIEVRDLVEDAPQPQPQETESGAQESVGETVPGPVGQELEHDNPSITDQDLSSGSVTSVTSSCGQSLPTYHLVSAKNCSLNRATETGSSTTTSTSQQLTPAKSVVIKPQLEVVAKPAMTPGCSNDVSSDTAKSSSMLPGPGLGGSNSESTPSPREVWCVSTSRTPQSPKKRKKFIRYEVHGEPSHTHLPIHTLETASASFSGFPTSCQVQQEGFVTSQGLANIPLANLAQRAKRLVSLQEMADQGPPRKMQILELPSVPQCVQLVGPGGDASPVKAQGRSQSQSTSSDRTCLVESPPGHFTVYCRKKKPKVKLPAVGELLHHRYNHASRSIGQHSTARQPPSWQASLTQQDHRVSTTGRPIQPSVPQSSPGHHPSSGQSSTARHPTWQASLTQHGRGNHGNLQLSASLSSPELSRGHRPESAASSEVYLFSPGSVCSATDSSGQVEMFTQTPFGESSSGPYMRPEADSDTESANMTSDTDSDTSLPALATESGGTTFKRLITMATQEIQTVAPRGVVGMAVPGNQVPLPLVTLATRVMGLSNEAGGKQQIVTKTPDSVKEERDPQDRVFPETMKMEPPVPGSPDPLNTGTLQVSLEETHARGLETPEAADLSAGSLMPPPTLPWSGDPATATSTVSDTWKVRVTPEAGARAKLSDWASVDPRHYSGTPHPLLTGRYVVPCEQSQSSDHVCAHTVKPGPVRGRGRGLNTGPLLTSTPLSHASSYAFSLGHQTSSRAVLSDISLNSTGSECVSSSLSLGTGPPDIDTPNNTPADGRCPPLTPLPSATQLTAALYQLKENLSEVDLDLGRQAHNLKERARRARIKTACEKMRELVPGLSLKTDKATVVEFAVHYIAFMRQLLGQQYDKEFLRSCSQY